MIKNAFSDSYLQAEGKGAPLEDLKEIFLSSALKNAALDGDVDTGKTEAGQSAGLINDLPGAYDLTKRLIGEYRSALTRLSELDIALERRLQRDRQSVL
jgi:enoyl-[acyl-carrier protein] reductase II